MSYKTILVHVDADPAAEQRCRFAADLALSFGAHLIGCAPTGISRFIPSDVLLQARSPLATICTALRADAADALLRFAQIVSEQGGPPPERRVIDDDACGMALHARYADLVVVGQPDRALPTHGSASDLPGYLLRESGRPVLVVPRRPAAASRHDLALVAWDGSIEAIRAIVGAMPLLRAAQSVNVVRLWRGCAGQHDDGAQCSQVVRYLKRHAIRARALNRSTNGDIGTTMLSIAADKQAGLLVMGGYGQSPLRESLLGGVTASVLASMSLPVLLAH